MFYQIYENLCNSNKHKANEYCKGSGLHRHHIIPKHNDGDNNDDNITYLTVREHIIAHYLLWKLYKNPNDLRSMHMLGAKLSPLQRKITGEYCRDNKIGFHDQTSFDIRARNTKSANTCKENNIGIFNPEMKKKWASDAGKKSYENGNNTKFMYWASPEGRKKRSSLGGEALKGYRMMYKPGDKTFIRVNPKNIEEYLNNGYILGSPLPSPMKGKTYISNKRIPIMIDGIRYSSFHECSQKLGCCFSTIKSRLLSDKWPTWVYDTEFEL